MGRRRDHPYFGKPRKSEYRGVSWAKWDAKWQATISIDGKQRHLGLFDNEIDAARARESAEEEYRRAADARVCIDREETAAAIFNAIQAAEHSSEHWKTFSPTQKAAQIAALIRQRPAVQPSVSPGTEAQAREIVSSCEVDEHVAPNGRRYVTVAEETITERITTALKSRSNAGYEDGIRACVEKASQMESTYSTESNDPRADLKNLIGVRGRAKAEAAFEIITELEKLSPEGSDQISAARIAGARACIDIAMKMGLEWEDTDAAIHRLCAEEGVEVVKD